MLKNIIPTGLAAVVFAAGLSLSAPAQAGGNVSVTFSGKHGSVTIGNHQRRHGKTIRKHHKPRRHYAVCQPGKALHKARDIGVRRAHVDRVGHKYIIVKGRKRGSQVKVAFERRSRRCNVAWVDRTPIYYGGHNHGNHYGNGYGHNYGHNNSHGHKRGGYKKIYSRGH